MKYTIYAALADEQNDGWVWLSTPTLATRTVVKIRNLQVRRTVFCQSRQLDQNFLTCYAADPHRARITDKNIALVMSAWYRGALGDLETMKEADLVITAARIPVWRDLRAACHHPEIVARIGTRLGILGGWLGLLGVLLPILEFFGLESCTKQILFVGVATISAVLGWIACRGISR